VRKGGQEHGGDCIAKKNWSNTDHLANGLDEFQRICECHLCLACQGRHKTDRRLVNLRIWPWWYYRWALIRRTVIFIFAMDGGPSWLFEQMGRFWFRFPGFRLFLGLNVPHLTPGKTIHVPDSIHQASTLNAGIPPSREKRTKKVVPSCAKLKG
jgi:hypothetical protein